MEEAALELIVWYLKQFQHQTYKTDDEIATELEWWMPRRFRQAALARGQKPVRVGALLSMDGKRTDEMRFPHGQRVREVRRWVDRQTDELFGQYHFGTRTNGAGRSLSSLTSPEATELLSREDSEEAAIGSVVGQVARAFQSYKQHDAEVLRIADKFSHVEGQCIKLEEHAQATACAMAATDLRIDGRLRPQTLARLVDTGLIEDAEQLS